MDLELPFHLSEKGAQLEEFGRRHRTGLVTLLFTDMVDSTALKQQWGDRGSAAVFQKREPMTESLAWLDRYLGPVRYPSIKP